jgi:hypothetical protein
MTASDVDAAKQKDVAMQPASGLQGRHHERAPYHDPAVAAVDAVVDCAAE